MKKRMLTRIMTFILSMALCFNLVQTPVFAQENTFDVRENEFRNKVQLFLLKNYILQKKVRFNLMRLKHYLILAVWSFLQKNFIVIRLFGTVCLLY